MIDSEATNKGAVEQAAEWAKFMAVLVPPDIAEIQDLTGATHRVRANLPAAVEWRILELLKDIRLPESVADAVSGVVEAQESRNPRGVLEGFATALGQAAGAHEILDQLAQAFGSAHPHILQRAIANVKADEDLVEYLPTDRPAVASDVFSTIDILGGIVPFVLRAVGRTGKQVGSLLPSSS